MVRAAVLQLVLATLFCVFQPAHARADHFAIDLEVKADGKTTTAKTDTFGLGAKPRARQTLDVAVGKPLAVKWTVASTAKKEVYKDVLVHFFIAKIDKAGQEKLPKLDKDVTYESALTMDFKPKDQSTAEVSVPAIKSPGVYMLRLETIGASVGTQGHEHFAAMDLVVK